MGGMIAVGALRSIRVLGYYGFSSLGPSVLAEKGFDIQKSLTFTSIARSSAPVRGRAHQDTQVGALVSPTCSTRTVRRTASSLASDRCWQRCWWAWPR